MAFYCGLDENDFYKIYRPQKGGMVGSDGRIFFRSNIGRQRGSGIGGIFGALAKRFLPFVQKYVFPHAKGLVRNLAADIVDNKRNWKEALKEHGKSAIKNIAHEGIDQIGSGRIRKRKNQKKKPRSINIYTDTVFDKRQRRL